MCGSNEILKIFNPSLINPTSGGYREAGAWLNTAWWLNLTDVFNPGDVPMPWNRQRLKKDFWNLHISFYAIPLRLPWKWF